jgi:hypothetical protein
MKDWRKIYKTEVRVTAICFILLTLTGGMLSSFYVLAKDALFTETFAPKYFVAGFPLHYFWLIVLSWLGATAIGIVWTLYMDKMEKDIG